jgi:hypothetical protein
MRHHVAGVIQEPPRIKNEFILLFGT